MNTLIALAVGILIGANKDKVIALYKTALASKYMQAIRLKAKTWLGK